MPEFFITPKHSVATGHVIPGEMICVGLYKYNTMHADGKGIGAEPHSHAEEMWIILTKGECEFREGDDPTWYKLKPGDVHFVPPGLLHEVRAFEPYEFLTVKNLINGKSVYDGGWVDGAEAAWEKVKVAYDESKKFPNNDPWFEGSGR